MTYWMMETLVWTALLIAFVLMVRRPVARSFGAQTAYALWALPALRLILPPIELPAWMRLFDEQAGLAATQQNAPLAIDPVVAITPTALDASTPRFDDAVVAHPAATDTTPPLTQTPMFDLSNLDTGLLIEVGVTVWLIGAAIFMISRFSAYFRLRDELLDNAREVGRSGSVRLVETPGTKAPLAFGVIDKVVALPEGFLAQPDRQARDLALAHELAHHEGRDLLANVLVQPLFAIHWWNPLGRYGWLALRRDQEAACDARVMACAEAKEREVYANLIVSFAAERAFAPNVAQHHALTAPMACPVLGEKSIIHRLRSLKMDNTNTKRKAAGKLLLGAAVVALPMTASISYAASEAPVPPASPDVSSVAVAPPAAPGAPEAPLPPEAPAAPMVEEQIIVIDPDGEVSSVDTNGENVFVWSSEEGEKEARVIFRSDDRSVRFLDRSDFPGRKSMSKEELERFLSRSEDSKVIFRNRGRTMRFFDSEELGSGGRLSEEQIEEILKDVREGLEEANEALENLPEIIESAKAEAEAARLGAGQPRVRVESSCKGGESEIVTETDGKDGIKIIRICQKRVMAEALSGLREARQSIKDSDMDKDARDRALEGIDQVISRWESAR